MHIIQQAITECLTEGTGYRQLAKKYGVSRSTINKCVQIHQGIHNPPPTAKQQKYHLSGLNSKPENIAAHEFEKTQELTQKIAMLEKQFAWEKLRSEALDTTINIAEKQLIFSSEKSLAAFNPGNKTKQR